MMGRGFTVFVMNTMIDDENSIQDLNVSLLSKVASIHFSSLCVTGIVLS
jgi:hypothetical protein